VPWICPRLFKRLLLNSFGFERLPAKSGKELNSMEYATNESSGIPGYDGAPATGMSSDDRGRKVENAAPLQYDMVAKRSASEACGAIATYREVFMTAYQCHLDGTQAAFRLLDVLRRVTCPARRVRDYAMKPSLLRFLRACACRSPADSVHATSSSCG
jgi:hypothetical protein